MATPTLSWSEIMDRAGWNPNYFDSNKQYDDNAATIAGDTLLQQNSGAVQAATDAAHAVQNGSRAEDEIHSEFTRDDALVQSWTDGHNFAGSSPASYPRGVSPGHVPGTGEATSITRSTAQSESERRERWQVEHASDAVSAAYAAHPFTRLADATNAAVTNPPALPAPTDDGAGGGGGDVDFGVVLPELANASTQVQACVSEYDATAHALAAAVESAAAEVGQHHEQQMVENFNDFANAAFSLTLTLQDIGAALAGLEQLTDLTHSNYQDSENAAANGQTGRH